MLVDHGAITQEQSDSLSLLNSNIGLHSNSLTSSLVDCINWGWQSWLKAKAIPDGFVVVPKELPEQIAEKMAIDRVDKPRHENDPVWSKIAEQSYKDKVKFKKWELWRDYKAMIEAVQEQSHE